MLLQKGFEFEPFQSQIPVNHPDSTELARRKWTVEYILYGLNFPGFTNSSKLVKAHQFSVQKNFMPYPYAKRASPIFF